LQNKIYGTKLIETSKSSVILTTIFYASKTMRICIRQNAKSRLSSAIGKMIYFISFLTLA